jgi:hypothetical protein
MTDSKVETSAPVETNGAEEQKDKDEAQQEHTTEQGHDNEEKATKPEESIDPKEKLQHSVSTESVPSSTMDSASVDSSSLYEGSTKSRSSTVTSRDGPNGASATTSAPKLPPRTASVASIKSVSSSLAAPVSNGIVAPHSPSSGPTQITRKISSPFSWLSRATKEPPVSRTTRSASESSSRRDTASTINSTSPELMLSKISETPTRSMTTPAQGRDSLRDRFKELRLRGEGNQGIVVTEDPATIDEPVAAPATGLAGFVARNTGFGLGIASPPATTEEKTLDPATLPGGATSPPTAPTSRRHSEQVEQAQVPVNWDLWQAVVYEGPAAVARTSPEELNRAIAGGIPSAIRGVVWQVMAQSKNEDLEGVYRELVARGTGDRLSDSSVASSPILARAETNGSKDTNGHGRDSEVSSMHSPLTSPTEPNGKTIDSLGNDPESLKEHAAMAERRKQRAKEDRVAIQKLEKTIKRDLGARTSYSKYTTAAGLQDGLFGLCKAYALFDEAVGYAQGMNFLAMPLLFNVSCSFHFCHEKCIALTILTNIFIHRCQRKKLSAY